MCLAIVDLGLSPGEADIFAVIGQFNAHFLTNLFENLRSLLQLQGIRVAYCQHGVFMPLFSTDGHGTAICPCANHLQREIGIVTVHSNKNTRFNLITPNRKIGMVRIDHLFRIDLRDILDDNPA